MPTLQQLRYLVAVADVLHFRRAAEECNVAQPTLSSQLKELETRLGADLVERSRSRVVLTPVGKEIAERSRRVLRDVDEIREIAKSRNRPLSSVVRVGVVQSVGSYFLPLIVPELHDQHPNLGLYIREALPDVLLRALEEGSLDLLFMPLPVKRANFETRSIFREPIHLVAPHDHRLASEAMIDPAMLRGETILSLERGHKLFEQVRMICEDYGAEISRDYEGTSLDTLRQMVATGMGISLMPALYIKSEVMHQDLVVARPFRGSPPSRTIGMVWRKSTAREAEFAIMANVICEAMKSNAPEVTVLG
ncbi:MAG: hydrogen peroxide-inducible genes activator [Pseudomonadota bacterium]